MNIAFITGKNRALHEGRGIGRYTETVMSLLERESGIAVKEYPVVTSELESWADIAHYPYFDFFQRSFVPAQRAKTVVTIHDAIPLVFPHRFPRGIGGTVNLWLQKNRLQKANAVITDSYHSKKDITRYLSMPSSLIHVVPLGVDDHFNSKDAVKKEPYIKQKYNISKPYILYVGDINWNKNVPGLISAFKAVKKIDPKFTLVLVGKAFKGDSTAEISSIKQLLQDNNLKNHVRLPGMVPEEDLSGLYAHSTLYVQPSFYEGFGLPVLEAMRSGALVVSSNQSSLPEIVRDSSMMFDPYNPDSMIALIKKALAMNTKARALHIRKDMQWSNRFTWEKTVQETKQVYTKILNAL